MSGIVEFLMVTSLDMLFIGSTWSVSSEMIGVSKVVFDTHVLTYFFNRR